MSKQDTLDHIALVRKNLQDVIELLGARSLYHDASKLVEPELSGYEVMHAELSPLAFGTPEYWAAVARHRPIVEHHFDHNPHHPEFYAGGINDMSLIDILEMLADWKAASDRPTSRTSFADGFEHNCQRFGISEQLKGILAITARKLNWM